MSKTDDMDRKAEQYAARYEGDKRIAVLNAFYAGWKEGDGGDSLLNALAACRDACPEPPPGDPREALWGESIGCPEAVPEYVKATLAAATAAQPQPLTLTEDQLDHLVTLAGMHAKELSSRHRTREDIKDYLRSIAPAAATAAQPEDMDYFVNLAAELRRKLAVADGALAIVPALRTRIEQLEAELAAATAAQPDEAQIRASERERVAQRLEDDSRCRIAGAPYIVRSMGGPAAGATGAGNV